MHTDSFTRGRTCPKMLRPLTDLLNGQFSDYRDSSGFEHGPRAAYESRGIAAIFPRIVCQKSSHRQLQARVLLAALVTATNA